MSDDWEVGDFALCVNDKWDNEGKPVPEDAPRRGEVRTVRGLYPNRKYGLFLAFEPKPPRAFLASHFVKVTPPREMIEQERKAGVPA